jgi:hypothetical protein
MTREELMAEVKKLREGIRAHRDSTKHELCWHHPQLWGLLPERIDPDLARAQQPEREVLGSFIDGSQPDGWQYVAEVQNVAKPVDCFF